jgi:3-hydroxybutyryl-CoA dehydrogenase
MQIVWFTDNAFVKATIEKWLQPLPVSTIFDNTCIPNTHLYIDACLNEEHDFFEAEKTIPILKNAVINKSVVSTNTMRCNFWPGFFTGSNKLEVCHNNAAFIQQTLQLVQTNFIEVPNTIGFITTRVVSMIINEAFFAVEQGVSSKADIDIAMKLGTNYPYGPFEWANLIGHTHIIQLLQTLQQQNNRYSPAPALLATV